MKSFLYSAAPITAALLLLPSSSIAQHLYSIDPTHSSAEFSVVHMMISKVNGEFSKVSGTVFFDPANPAADKIDATIDVTTVSTRDTHRDDDLKSPNFLDASKYPTLTFRSTGASKENGRLLVKGDLTLHGVTKPVALEVEGPTSEVKDPWGNQRVGASASTTINRKDFGLTWNKTVDNGGVMVGDDVKITIDVELMRKP